MALQIIRNVPNPLYLLTYKEIFDAARAMHPISAREEMKINFVPLDFYDPDPTKEMLCRMNLEHYRGYVNEVFIAAAILPPPHDTPHHVREDGNVELMPGRDGPMRTYYDGSSLDIVSRVAVLRIDNALGRITMQCARGLDFSDRAQSMIYEYFRDYEHVTIQHVQQTDEHSSGLYCLYNMLSMSGIKPAKETLDVSTWRAEVWDVLRADAAEKAATGREEPRPSATAETPIYAKRYIMA